MEALITKEITLPFLLATAYFFHALSSKILKAFFEDLYVFPILAWTKSETHQALLISVKQT